MIVNERLYIDLITLTLINKNYVYMQKVHQKLNTSQYNQSVQAINDILLHYCCDVRIFLPQFNEILLECLQLVGRFAASHGPDLGEPECVCK